MLSSLVDVSNFLRSCLQGIGSLLKDTSLVVCLKAVGAVASFFLNLYIARILGSSGAGVYFLALTVTTICTVIGRLGTDNPIIRFTAAGAVEKKWAEVKGVYRRGMSLSISASFGAALIVFSLAGLLSGEIFKKPELTYPLRLMMFAVVPLVTASLNSKALLGLKRILYSQILDTTCVPTVTLLLFITIGRHYYINGVIGSYICASIITSLIAYLLWRKSTPMLRHVKGYFSTTKLLNASRPLLLVSAMNLIMNWIGTILLGIWYTTSDVGIFSVACRVATMTAFILQAVNSIISPRFAEYFQSNDLSSVISLVRKASVLLIGMGLPVCAILVLYSRAIMAYFGSSFIAGSIPLAILAVAQFFNVIAGSTGPILMMSGNEKSMRNSIVFSSMLNIVISIFLIPYFGIVGAAVANGISLVAANMYCIYAINRKLHFSPISVMNRNLNRYVVRP